MYSPYKNPKSPQTLHPKPEVLQIPAARSKEGLADEGSTAAEESRRLGFRVGV